jgi:hypothetical protein
MENGTNYEGKIYGYELMNNHSRFEIELGIGDWRLEFGVDVFRLLGSGVCLVRV